MFEVFLVLLMSGVLFAAGAITESFGHKPHCDECSKWKADIKHHRDAINSVAVTKTADAQGIAMAEPMFRIIASTRQPGTCRSNNCRAAITWCKTFPNQKAMPLHGSPIALKTEHDNDHGLIEYIASADSHWAHCIDSPKFGKR